MKSGEEPSDEVVDRVLSALPEGAAAGEHVDDGVLIAYQRGALEAAVVEEVDRHLAVCTQCRELLVELGRGAVEGAEDRALATLVELSRARTRRRFTALGALAVAAAALFAVWWIEPGVFAPEERAVASASAYQIEGWRGVVGGRSEGAPMSTSTGADAAARSPDGVEVFTPEFGVAWVLRPVEAIETEVVLSVFVSQRGLPLESVALTGVVGPTDDTPMLVARRAPSGAFEVRGRGKHIFGSRAGDYLVTFVVAPPGSSCAKLAGLALVGARARCHDAIFWRDLPARFEL